MIYLSQFIFIHEGKEEAFHEFEDHAIPLMEKYGGRIIYRIRPEVSDFVFMNEEKPYEIHFMSFESEKHLEQFLRDDERLAFIQLKEASVRASLLVKGEKMS